MNDPDKKVPRPIPSSQAVRSYEYTLADQINDGLNGVGEGKRDTFHG